MNFPDSVTQAFLRAEEAAANAGGREIVPEALAVRLATPAVSIPAPREKGFELEDFQAETGVADMLLAFMVRVEFDRDRTRYEADLIVDDLKRLQRHVAKSGNLMFQQMVASAITLAEDTAAECHQEDRESRPWLRNR